MRDRGYSRKEKSPSRQAIVSQLDEHSNRIKQLLRADLSLLEQENAILKAKCKKVNQLEDKIEHILKQNSQLLTQNQRLSKVLHQKKSQYQILKDKFDSQMAQKMGLVQETEYQKKKLLKQIDHLANEINEVERIKNSQIQQLKSQYQLQIQSLKRQTSSTQQVYQQEIRKFRDLSDKKDYELNQISNKLKRISSQNQYQIMKLRQEKQKLRSQLLYIEQDRKKQIQILRTKLQANYIDEIQTIKKSHFASVDNFQAQNIKLKDLLQKRNQQIDQLTTKNIKQKTHLQDSISILRKQNQNFRAKLFDYERLFDNQKQALKIKLSQMHESQLLQIKANHQKYIECIQSQIAKLDKIVAQKNSQIQQLIKQKASIRQVFDSQGNRYKLELQVLQQRLKQGQFSVNDKIEQYQKKLRDKDNHINYLDQLNQDEAANFESQRNSFKQLIQNQKKELQSEKLTWRQKEQSYKQSLNDYKSQNQHLKQTSLREKTTSMRQIDDINSQFELKISTLQSRVDSLTSKLNVLQKQNKSMKDTVAIKDKQIKNLNQRYRAIQTREKKLQKQNDQLRTKLIKKDQRSNQMLIEQKQRLEGSFAFTLENLKNDHESAMKMQANKYNDVKQKLRRRDIQTQDLMKTYKRMREQMQALTEQQSNKKDMTLKFPGATADLIATKNLFDIYLKTKVIDICGDSVDQKQNVYKK